MPLVSIAAQNASLDNDYGASKGAAAPLNLQVALFVGDPLADGTELAATTETSSGVFEANGYARVTVANDGTVWAAASGGRKSTVSPVQFPTVLVEWPDTVTHFQLYDAATGDAWDSAPLSEPLEVTAAGTGPQLALSVFYDDSVPDLTDL